MAAGSLHVAGFIRAKSASMNAGRIITLLQALDPEHWTSGSVLAERLGISRAAVSLDLRHATNFGVLIHKSAGLGYRLDQPIHWLDQTLLRQQLEQHGLDWAVEIVAITDSTNQQLRKEQGNTPKALLAEWQSAGRGRRGRQWLSALGQNLLLSLRYPLQRDVSALAGVSLVVGLAVLEALEEAGIDDCQLKWPNDVLRHGAKLAGILIEVEAEAGGATRLIIGIGLNLYQAPEISDQRVTDLAAYRLDRTHLSSLILKALAHYLARFAQDGFEPFREEFNRKHAFQQKTVRLELPDHSNVCGHLIGVGSQGELLLEQSNSVQRYYSAELSLRPQEPLDASIG
jgi:BirA family transcriptional regulator, biotin operon repressor / biotin---[acetyl-CoA-carboxylase] ligase